MREQSCLSYPRRPNAVLLLLKKDTELCRLHAEVGKRTDETTAAREYTCLLCLCRACAVSCC